MEKIFNNLIIMTLCHLFVDLSFVDLLICYSGPFRVNRDESADDNIFL